MKTISVLNYSREGGYGADSVYFLSYLQAQGTCTVHTGETKPTTDYDPYIFDPEDEATWPTEEQWPGFNIEDESTWPTISPETSGEPGGEEEPSESDPPEEGEVVLPPEAQETPDPNEPAVPAA